MDVCAKFTTDQKIRVFYSLLESGLALHLSVVHLFQASLIQVICRPLLLFWVG